MAIPSGSGTEVIKSTQLQGVSTTATDIITGVSNHIYIVVSIIITEAANQSGKDFFIGLFDCSCIKETISDCTEVFKATEINFLSDILNKEGVIRFLKTDDSITRKIIDQLDQELKELGSNGLGGFKIENKDISGTLSKLISESEKEFLISQGNGVFLFQAGQEMEIAPFLDHIRRFIFKPTTEEQFTFCWIDNFPYFEVENGNLQPSHHPFTAPTN